MAERREIARMLDSPSLMPNCSRLVSQARGSRVADGWFTGRPRTGAISAGGGVGAAFMKRNARAGVL